MVTITLHCAHCGSDALVRDGHAPNGKQKYRCHACGRRSRENPTPNAYPEACREEILHASQEREPLARPHAHVRGLSHHRVKLDQKKGVRLLTVKRNDRRREIIPAAQRMGGHRIQRKKGGYFSSRRNPSLEELLGD